jgi:small redox-active disulfide protein 2
MELRVLGPGCMNCQKLAANAEAAARELGVEYRLEKVTDFAAILSHGVRRTPALAVNGKVVVQGRVPGADEIMSLLAQEMV